MLARPRSRRDGDNESRIKKATGMRTRPGRTGISLQDGKRLAWMGLLVLGGWSFAVGSYLAIACERVDGRIGAR